MLHGGGGNPGWTPYHEELAVRFHVIAPTRPGFGALGHSHRWFCNRIKHLDGLIWFYHRFLKSQKLSPLPVMGVCMGGWLAAKIAVRYPESFSRMVLVGSGGLIAPVLDPFRMTGEEAKAAIFHDAAQVPDDYLRCLQRGYRAVARDWKVADRITLPARHNPELTSWLTELRIPTQIVWGRNDAVLPMEHGERYRRSIPDARLEIVDHCGHHVHIEKPDTFFAAVLPFLTQERARDHQVTRRVPALA